MTPSSEIFDLYAERYATQKQGVLDLKSYLEGCREDQMMYASSAERMMAAIGEPKIIDTSRDERLGRIFMNRSVKVYPTFNDFYGLEETIERIVSYFRHAAQGLEGREAIALAPESLQRHAAKRRKIHDTIVRYRQLLEPEPLERGQVGDGAFPDMQLPQRSRTLQTSERGQATLPEEY